MVESSYTREVRMFLTEMRMENVDEYLYQKSVTTGQGLSKEEIHKFLFVDNGNIISSIPRVKMPTITSKMISNEFEKEIDAMLLSTIIGLHIKKYKPESAHSPAMELCSPSLVDLTRLMQFTNFDISFEI